MRFMDEKIALFEEFVYVWRWLGASGDRNRRVVRAGLGRVDAPQARVTAITLRGLLEFLFAATVTSHSSVPAEFLGFNAPLFYSDLLGRRRVKIPGGLRAVVRCSLRLGRLEKRALGGGERRGYRSSSGSSSGDASGAQRGSHLEASPSIYSLSPTAAAAVFFFCTTCKQAVNGAGQKFD